MIKSGFALQTLLHVVRLAAKGDIKTALNLGIKEHQINELLTLSSQELHDMANMSHSPFIKIEFDSDLLETALRINERHSQRRQEILNLIRSGASYPIMKHLYGMTNEEMSNFKKITNSHQHGRPVKPDDEMQEQLWHLMQPINSLDDPRLPGRLIDAHSETGVKVSSIWILLKEWWLPDDNPSNAEDKENKEESDSKESCE